MPKYQSKSNTSIYIVVVLFLFLILYVSYRRPSLIDKFETIEPSTEFPLVAYTEANYGGTPRQINNSNINNRGFWVKSIKLLDGKKLTVTKACDNNSSAVTTKTFTASTPNFNPCGWTGIFNNSNTTFVLENDTSSPSDAFPVIAFSGPNFTGEVTPISSASAPTLNKFVRSVKIKPGYILILRNHQCISSAATGCSNNAFIPFRYWTTDNPNFSPCSDDLKCYGITVLPNTLFIGKNTPWALILNNLTHTYDAAAIAYQNMNLCGSLSNGYKGIYVGFYWTGNSWGQFKTLNGTGPPPRLNYEQGHYPDDIMNQIQFNTVNVWIDRLGDGNSGVLYTLTRKYTAAQAEGSTIYFYDPSIPSILSKLRAPGNYNVLEANNTMISGNRYISIWIENR